MINSTSNFQGTATTRTTGGMPIFAGTHDQTITVKMFHDADPAGANAISAREMLGDKWQELVKQGPATTC